MKGKAALLVTLLCIAAVAPATAMATIVSFGATYGYSGTAPAAATPPSWLTTQFNDHDASGSVTLTLSATNLTGTEFVGEWYLNLDPTLSPNNLHFSTPTKVGSFDDPTVSTGVDQFKADGDGYFDIYLDFATSAGDSSRFTAGDSVSYIIDGISSLTANSFKFLSATGGGEGIYPMAAHVQNTPGGGVYSGWVSVPEPSVLLLLSTGMAGLLGYGRL